MDNFREKAGELLCQPKMRALYANTFYSLADRLEETGYLEESFVPGRYPGCFARSSGAYVFLMAEAGELPLAERALRFVLDTMARRRLRRPPHVMGRPRYRMDGALEQELDMVCQIDGTAHILSAYGELILRYGRRELYEDYWPMMAEIMDAHADQPYFFANEGCAFPVANIDLFLNTAFEHSREERYWCCFDLLTQSFMGAALEKMARIARENRQEGFAERWEAQLRRLRAGIRRGLTAGGEQEAVYLEMRLPDSSGGIPYEGMGWVSLSPVAAGWEALPPEVMRRTAQALRERLWRPDPAGGGFHFLSKDTLPQNGYCLETIGKGTGWDMEAARRSGDFAHVWESLAFLAERHDGDLFGECMFYTDGRWHTRDCGNAEQSIWWCWAVSRLRETLGLPRRPDRADVTRPIPDTAGKGLQD